MKPTVTFIVTTGPVVIPNDEGADVLVEPLQHRVEGTEFKYVSSPDGQAFFHVLNAAGTVVFMTPAGSVLWVTTSKAEQAPLMLVEDMESEEVDVPA